MERKSQRMQFRLTAAEKASLRYAAASKNQTESELVRKALKSILSQESAEQNSTNIDELKKG